MTFIQPNKNSGILNKILAVLVVAMVFGGISIVVLYNKVVNLNHGVGELKAEFVALQSENAESQDKIFKLLDVGNDSAVLAADYKLVEDKNPEYLEINSKWYYASGR